MLVLDGSPYAAIGIEVNVDYISAVAVDLKGEELLNWRRSFPGGTSSAGQAVVAMAALARRVVSRMTKEARQVLGLTVAVPGLVDVNGNVRVAPNLGWRDADLAGDLTKALRDPGFPVLVDNDANLAALAEHRFGPHRNAANLVYVTGEVGVGAGIIMDGLPGGAGRATAARSATSSSTPPAHLPLRYAAAWRPSPGSARSSRTPRPTPRRPSSNSRSTRSYAAHATANRTSSRCWRTWGATLAGEWPPWPTCSTPRS